MSFNARNSAQQRYLSARYNRRRRRMERVEEAADGTILALGDRQGRQIRRAPVVERDDKGLPVALVCSDQSRRYPGTTGKEGAFLEACRLIKLPLIPVIIPNQPPPNEDAKDPAAEEGRVHAIGLNRAEAIAFGMRLEDGRFVEMIGYEEAAKKYGHFGVDPCEKTYASKIGKRS